MICMNCMTFCYPEDAQFQCDDGDCPGFMSFDDLYAFAKEALEQIEESERTEEMEQAAQRGMILMKDMLKLLTVDSLLPNVLVIGPPGSRKAQWVSSLVDAIYVEVSFLINNNISRTKCPIF